MFISVPLQAQELDRPALVNELEQLDSIQEYLDPEAIENLQVVVRKHEIYKQLDLQPELRSLLINSRSLFKSLGDQASLPLIARLYGALIDSYRYASVLDSAQLYANELFLHVESLENNSNLTTDYELLHAKLLTYYYRALAVGSSVDVAETVGMLEQGIGLINSIDVTEAYKAYPAFRYGFIYQLHGRVMLTAGKRMEAILSYNEYLKEGELVDDAGVQSAGNYFIGRIHRLTSEPEKALSLLNRVDVTNLDPSIDLDAGQVYSEIAEVYHLLNNYDSARAYENKATVEILLGGDLRAAALRFSKNAASAKRNGDWSRAYGNYARLSSYLSTNLRATNERNLGRLESQLESEQIQNQLNAKVDKANGQRLIIGIIAAALIIINIFIFRSLRLSRKARRLELIEVEKLEADKEVEALKKEKLSSILEFKNRQLATTTLSTERLYSQIDLVIEKLQQLNVGVEGNENSKQINSLIRELRSTHNTQDSWAQFYKHFESVHPNFFNRLTEINSQLTQNELRHCAYVVMGLSNKEVANMSNISPNSVKTARTRLKRRLGIEAEASLTDFIQGLTDGMEGQYLMQA